MEGRKILKLLLHKSPKLILWLSLFIYPCCYFDSFISRLEGTLERLSCLKGRFMVSGDFNVDLNKSSDESMNLRNVFQSYGCFCTDCGPTRGNSHLDRFATSLKTWDFSVQASDEAISDHSDIGLTLTNSSSHEHASNENFEFISSH